MGNLTEGMDGCWGLASSHDMASTIESSLTTVTPRMEPFLRSPKYDEHDLRVQHYWSLLIILGYM